MSVVITVRRVLWAEPIHAWVHVDKHDRVVVATSTVRVVKVTHPLTKYVELVVVKSFREGDGDTVTLGARFHAVFGCTPTIEITS